MLIGGTIQKLYGIGWSENTSRLKEGEEVDMVEDWKNGADQIMKVKKGKCMDNYYVHTVSSVLARSVPTQESLISGSFLRAMDEREI